MNVPDVPHLYHKIIFNMEILTQLRYPEDWGKQILFIRSVEYDAALRNEGLDVYCLTKKRQCIGLNSLRIRL